MRIGIKLPYAGYDFGCYICNRKKNKYYYEKQTKEVNDMKVTVNKKMVMTGLSAIFAAGAFVVDAISKKDKEDEVIQKAAEKVMEQLAKE